MDPNATLAEMEQILANPAVIDDARLAELRAALLAWLDRGGFAPQWSHYPRATRAVRSLTVSQSDHTFQVLGPLHGDPTVIAVRLPAHLARDISGGCQCPHCLTRGHGYTPTWDTLIIPLRPGAYTYTIHAPELRPAPPAPVTGPDPRD